MYKNIKVPDYIKEKVDKLLVELEEWSFWNGTDECLRLYSLLKEYRDNVDCDRYYLFMLYEYGENLGYDYDALYVLFTEILGRNPYKERILFRKYIYDTIAKPIRKYIYGRYGSR